MGQHQVCQTIQNAFQVERPGDEDKTIEQLKATMPSKPFESADGGDPEVDGGSAENMLASDGEPPTQSYTGGEVVCKSPNPSSAYLDPESDEVKEAKEAKRQLIRQKSKQIERTQSMSRSEWDTMLGKKKANSRPGTHKPTVDQSSTDGAALKKNASAKF